MADQQVFDEPYHVPQQSRRDKLRILDTLSTHQQLLPQMIAPTPTTTTTDTNIISTNSNLRLHQELSSSGLSLAPLCEPSSFTTTNISIQLLPDLQPCAQPPPINHFPASPFHPQTLQFPSSTGTMKHNAPDLAFGDSHVKQEGYHQGFSLMGFMGNNTSTVPSASSSCAPPNRSTTLLRQQHQGMSLNPNQVRINPVLYSLHNNNGDFGYRDGNGLVLDNSQQLGSNHHHHHVDHDKGKYNVVGAAAEPTGQGLSLSLSSSQQSQWTPANLVPLDLSFETCIRDVADVGCSVAPLGPFTGYTSILKSSRFVRAARELLNEVCDIGDPQNTSADKVLVLDPSLLVRPPTGRSTGMEVAEDLRCGGGEDDGRYKSKLISMLEEVCSRYKQYYQQLQAIIASFENVVGLSDAAPFINLAFKTMSKHFRCLRYAITEQLHSMTKAPSNVSCRKDGVLKHNSYDKYGFYSSRLLQNSGRVDQPPVWRPQRGLPERAVSVLRAWLFENFLRPYPTDTDKMMLAKQTGLSRSQVSNWFINARVRLWKPMVEEIYALETQQAQKATLTREEYKSSTSNDNIPSTTLLSANDPSTSAPQDQDPAAKRARKFLPELRGASEHPMSLQYHQFPNTVCGDSGVSLTLDLHQDNRVGSPEPFPITPINLSSIWNQRQY